MVNENENKAAHWKKEIERQWMALEFDRETIVLKGMVSWKHRIKTNEHLGKSAL